MRRVAGLTVAEIARAFLSSESAIERRLVRARRKITDARTPFRVPADDLLPERLNGVLRVVYLVFTEATCQRAPTSRCAGSCARRRSGSRACWPG